MSSAEVSLNASAKEWAAKALAAQKLQRDALKAKQKELQALQQIWMREEIERRQANGEEVGAMETFRIMKSTLGRMQVPPRGNQTLLPLCCASPRGLEPCCPFAAFL